MDVVTVRAIGMVTPLGLDWATSCAAARAGLLRSAQLEFKVQRPDTNDVELVSGHQVPFVAGFEGFGRWLVLLTGALRALLKDAESNGVRLESARLFLALPDVTRTAGNSDSQQDPDDPQEPWDTPQRLVEKARRFSSWPFGLELARLERSGPCGAVAMIKAAMAELDSGACNMAIVAALDSLVDENVLEWLQAEGRLKNPGLASGVTPGEAGVLLCLVRGESSEGMAVIQAIEWQEKLSQVLRSLAAKMPQSSEPMWLISDLNGESKQASEIGTAIVASRTRVTQSWLPAVSFGDTGVAGPALGIAMAAAAWRRGYAAGNRCVVLSSADASARAGILLAPPGGVRR